MERDNNTTNGIMTNKIYYSTGNAIKITGDFFKTGIILPHPDEYLNPRESEMVTMNVFTSIMKTYGFYSEHGVQPVSVNEFMQELETVILDKVGNELTFNQTTPDAVRNVVKNTVANVYNGLVKNGSKEDTIRQSGIIRVMRLVLQTLYDKLSYTQTHMRVETPFNIAECKWENVTETCDSNEPITMNFGTTNTIEVNGSMFRERVIIPVPNTATMAAPEAETLAKTVFDWSTGYTNGERESKFTTVRTTAFADDLRESIIDALRTDCTQITSDNTEELISVVDNVFPDEETYKRLPGEIRSRNIVIHITRMVLQTLFDQIPHEQTHMSVENPFNVTEHKWDELILSRVKHHNN